MHWEERLLALFDDLEQQAEGLALSARDAEVAELGRAEYAQVDLASRLHGSVGRRVGLVVEGVGRLDVVLARVGAEWCLADDGAHEWLVRMDGLVQVSGLGELAVDARHRSVGARLGFGSALRGVADEGLPMLLHLRGGGTVRGTVRRVGADFVELLAGARGDVWGDAGSARPEVVAFGAVTAARRT